MKLLVNFEVFAKDSGNLLLSDCLYMSITKKEAFALCQNYYIYNYPDKVETVFTRAQKKIRQAVREKLGLTYRQYSLDFDLSIQDSGVFCNSFIKEFFKHLLEDAYVNYHCTIYNDTGLSYFFYEAIRALQPYYQGNLTEDARAIQAKIVG